MNGSELSKITHENYSKVTISKDPKHNKHSPNVGKMASKVFGFIGRNFEYKYEKNYTYTI